MRRFTELLILVASTLPPLPVSFVNGLQFEALQPSIKNIPLRTDATIRGLLVPRQFFCPSGFGACVDMVCCPINWICCGGLSLSPYFEFKFHRRAKISQTAKPAANPRKFFWLQVSIVWSRFCYRTYCVLGTNGIVGCCPDGKLCFGPAPPPGGPNNPPPPPPPPPTTHRECIPWFLQCFDIYDLIANPPPPPPPPPTTHRELVYP